MTETKITLRDTEQGFLLVGVIVMVALVLLFLSVAAPVVAKDLRRERELEAVHRGQQYTRAIRLYHLKFNGYPASMEALEKSNNVRYLRQQYVDPMTGKNDWRVIPVGQAKTTVKGFFGEPLSGLGGGGLGSASSLTSSQQAGGSGSTFSGQSGAFGGQSGGQSGAFGGQSGTTGTTGSGTGTNSGSSTFGSSSFGTSGSSSSSNPLSGGAGPFLGVGLKKDGASIMTLNEQTDYSTWEFIYDPRIEQLLSKVSLFGGGVSSQSSGSLGSASNLSGTNPSNGFGSSSGSSGSTTGGFGSSSGLGSSSGSGTTTGSGGSNPTTPPQQ